MSQPVAISTSDLDILDPGHYGGKAYWLSWLQKQGYTIPYTIFLPVMSTLQELFHESQKLACLRNLLEPMRVDNKYGIAVRSSATIEDSNHESLAGHFSTFIGFMTFNEVIHRIEKVVASLENVGMEQRGKMGVVLQERVNARFAGIALSSDPFISAKYHCLISVIPGMGSPLMSGEKSGEDITLYVYEDDFTIPHYKTEIPQAYLLEVGRIAKKIEATLGHPVDIEWCVDEQTGHVYIVQCRYATGSIYAEPRTIQVSLQNEKLLPLDLSHHEKVLLRLIGERSCIPVSKAFLVTVNCKGDEVDLPDLSAIQPSPECNGYSVVLLRPDKLAGKVARSFVSQNEQDMDFVKTCVRYSVRSYPEHSTLQSSIESIAKLCAPNYWTACLIVQEIFDPKYAGIIKRVSDGYTIELAYGHFIPKGVVPTSRYILDENGNFLDKNEVYQLKRFRILNGYIVEESIELTDCHVSLDRESLVTIVNTFLPLLSSSHTAVEFGVLARDQGQTLHPYLIDFIEDKSTFELSSRNIVEGILSVGVITGKAVLFHQNESVEDTFNMHFHDQLEDQELQTENYIFCCQLPSMSLLKIIQKFPHNRLGFVFREGSVLCHLAIILREQGIPAIIVEKLPEVQAGEQWTINASMPGLKGRERLQRYDEQD